MDMSKQKQKEFEKWCRPKLEKIQKILLLEHFNLMEFEYDSTSDSAYCKFSYPYNNIRIHYCDRDLLDFENKKYKEVMKTLVHEMIHPLTDPLYNLAIQRLITEKQVEAERERLTDHIANIVLKNNLI